MLDFASHLLAAFLGCIAALFIFQRGWRVFRRIGTRLEQQLGQREYWEYAWVCFDVPQGVLREGRNRQVRRMTAAVGHPCLRLVRAAVGKVTLKDLAPGKWRWVDRREL